MKLYPIADLPTRAEQEALGITYRDAFRSVNGGPLSADVRTVRAVATREYRSPKAGEWYLSGAEIAAYRAKNDYPSMRFHIARLVLVELREAITTLL